jgi:hypothetical protein
VLQRGVVLEVGQRAHGRVVVRGADVARVGDERHEPIDVTAGRALHDRRSLARHDARERELRALVRGSRRRLSRRAHGRRRRLLLKRPRIRRLCGGGGVCVADDSSCIFLRCSSTRGVGRDAHKRRARRRLPPRLSAI